MAIQIFTGIDAVPLKVFEHGRGDHNLAECEARGHTWYAGVFCLHCICSDNELAAPSVATQLEMKKAKSVARLGFSFRGVSLLWWYCGTARYAPLFQVIRACGKDRALFNFGKTKRLERASCANCKG